MSKAFLFEQHSSEAGLTQYPRRKFAGRSGVVLIEEILSRKM